MKKGAILILMLIFLLFSFGSAHAFPLFPGTPSNPGTQFEDDNLEYWDDNNGDGSINEGDVLYAGLEFGKIIDLTGGNPSYDLDTDSDELVAWSTIELDEITPDGWFFKEHNDTPMVEVYSGGSNDYVLDVADSDPTKDDAEAAIKDGTFLWSFSTTDDPDTFWRFNPLDTDANDPSYVKTLSSATKVGVANYQLNQVGGNDIFTLIEGATVSGGDGLVNLIGSADIIGGNGLTDGESYAFARSDADAVVNPIPEPTTLLLFGTGLLGLAAFGRKRFMKK